jgi:hypothetical protein
MNEKRPYSGILPLIFSFLGICLLVGLIQLAWGKLLPFPVLWWGNSILFLASVLSFLSLHRALHNPNGRTFVRLVYTGMLIKMAICLGAVFVYGMLGEKGISPGGILCCFGFYILYTFVEIRGLLRTNKSRTHA